MNRPTNLGAAARRLAVGTALALGLAGAALAQPAGHHGGFGAADGMLARALHAANARLNLNTSQQQLWDSAVAQSKAAGQAIRANRARLDDALHAELAKPAPDFAGVAALGDEVAQQNRAQQATARAQWLNLYATLSPEQKIVVRDIIAQRVARADAFRARMRERHQPPSNG